MADPLPAAVPPAPPPPPVQYRPLSGLALTGFVLAVGYAILMLGGAVLALATHVPWLLPGWTLLVPILGFLLSWVARSRIRNSEDTLGGAGMASWGMGLSACLGLSYAAFTAGTQIAVRQQATAFVEDRWLDRLKKGEIEQAFLLTLRHRAWTPTTRSCGRRWKTATTSARMRPRRGRTPSSRSLATSA